MEFEYRNFDPTRPVLGTLASYEIVIDRPNSHNHLVGDVSPEAATDALEFALSQIDSEGQDYVVAQVDCGETVLYTQCVEATPKEEIVYAYRHDRRYQTRFVLNREPEPTNFLMAVLLRNRHKPGIMVLLTAKGGEIAYPEPWDHRALKTEAEKAASIEYWNSHALVWDPATVDFSRPFGHEPDQLT